MAVDCANNRKPKTLVSIAITSVLLSLTVAAPLQAQLIPHSLDGYMPVVNLGNHVKAADDLASSAANGGADASEVYVLTVLEKQAKDDAAKGNTELLDLLKAASGNDAKAAKLAAELTPDRSGAGVYNVILAQDLFTQSIRKRSADFLLGDSARSSFWATFLGAENTSYVTSDGSNRYDGFDATSTGIAFGFDLVRSKNTIMGVAFSQQNVDSASRLLDNSLEIESYQAALYGTQSWGDYYLSGRGVIGWNAHTSSRMIGGEESLGRYNSNNFALEFDLTRPVYWGDFSILPTVSTSYTHVRIEDYSDHYVTETDRKGKVTHVGGSVAALAYEQQNYQELNFGLGLELAYSLYTDFGALQTRAGFKTDIEMLDMELTTTARLASGGDSFTVAVNDNEELQYESYVDLTWETNGSFTWSLGLQHNWDDTSKNSMVYGRAIYSF